MRLALFQGVSATFSVFLLRLRGVTKYTRSDRRLEDVVLLRNLRSQVQSGWRCRKGWSCRKRGNSRSIGTENEKVSAQVFMASAGRQQIKSTTICVVKLVTSRQTWDTDYMRTNLKPSWRTDTHLIELRPSSPNEAESCRS